MLHLRSQELAVHKLNEPTSAASTVRTESSTKPWHVEIGELLTQAAILCVEHGADLDAFMKGAWAAYIEARPGLRDELEDLQLRQQLEELRKLDRIAKA
jgi:hypothetical protein